MSGAEHQTADSTTEEHAENTQHAKGAALPPARSTGKKALAVFGAGALLAGGGMFAYNSLHQSEEAFSADGEEYAQVCQDANTGLRVDDAECEKAEQESGNTSSDSGSGSSGDSHTGTSNSGATNAFLWYYLGRRSAGGTTIPSVGSSLSGGSTTRPSSGTVYSGLSRNGGGFESSYKSAKKTSTYSSGKVTESRSGGKTTTSNKGTGLTGNKSGSNSGNKGGSSGSKGGFGGGSKSGGGTSGG